MHLSNKQTGTQCHLIQGTRLTVGYHIENKACENLFYNVLALRLKLFDGNTTPRRLGKSGCLQRRLSLKVPLWYLEQTQRDPVGSLRYAIDVPGETPLENYYLSRVTWEGDRQQVTEPRKLRYWTKQLLQKAACRVSNPVLPSNWMKILHFAAAAEGSNTAWPKIKLHMLLLVQVMQWWDLMEKVRNVTSHQSRSPHRLCCLRFWLSWRRQQGLQSWNWLCWNTASSSRTTLLLDETSSTEVAQILRSFQTWDNFPLSFWP